MAGPQPTAISSCRVVGADRESLETVDFVPFRSLSDLPIAMTAHVVYSALDPHRPATTSRKVVAGVIRTEIGFDGLLLSDDLSMQALSGSLGERAAAAFSAGVDVALHCNGDLAEAQAVAAAAPLLEGKSLARAAAALARIARGAGAFRSCGRQRGSPIGACGRRLERPISAAAVVYRNCGA